MKALNQAFEDASAFQDLMRKIQDGENAKREAVIEAATGNRQQRREAARAAKKQAKQKKARI